jgi:hypothetical protein
VIELPRARGHGPPTPEKILNDISNIMVEFERLHKV